MVFFSSLCFSRYLGGGGGNLSIHKLESFFRLPGTAIQYIYSMLGTCKVLDIKMDRHLPALEELTVKGKKSGQRSSKRTAAQ